MASLPRWCPVVCSDLNLSAFQSWMQQQNHHTAEQYMDLYLIVHEDPPLPEFIKNLISTDVYNIWPTVTIDNIKVHIPRRPCVEVGCARCGARGGYKFHWQGPWTCLASVQPTITTAAETRRVWMQCNKCANCRTRRVTNSGNV